MEYSSVLNLLDTEIAIKFIKDTFERELAKALKLTRVSAPLFVLPETGLNDNLNGYERAVRFDVLTLKKEVEIVQSLAKWKRNALSKYKFTGTRPDYETLRSIWKMEKSYMHPLNKFRQKYNYYKPLKLKCLIYE